MRSISDLFVGLFLCCAVFPNGLCLQCWKCVSDDCGTDPELSDHAVVVRCKLGEQCMKVHYKMFDNITRFESVIRTCTRKSCMTSSNEEFLKCVATPKLYMINGCSLSLCCKDRDLCNAGRSRYVTSYINWFLNFVVMLYFKDI